MRGTPRALFVAGFSAQMHLCELGIGAFYISITGSPKAGVRRKHRKTSVSDVAATLET